MNGTVKQTLALALALGVGIGLGMVVARPTSAFATPSQAAAGQPPRYTVVETLGTNLLVTDNQTNTFYFYACDKDQPVGSDLKLRGTLDLTQVGKPVLKPHAAK